MTRDLIRPAGLCANFGQLESDRPERGVEISGTPFRTNFARCRHEATITKTDLTLLDNGTLIYGEDQK